MIRSATPADAEDVARLLAAFRSYYGVSEPDDASFLRSVRRLMVEAAITRARERGAGRIELDVDDANPRARGLYESIGFTEKNGGSAYMQLRF